MSKRAHTGKTEMQNMPRKTVLLEDVSKSRIDELFEHNKAVNIGLSPADQFKAPNIDSLPKQYSDVDISHFKNIVMQLICKGQPEEVEHMLMQAPSYGQHPGFTDARTYKFSMFRRDVGELREDKVCSPLAIAVSVGDANLVEVILGYLRDLDIEEGLVVR